MPQLCLVSHVIEKQIWTYLETKMIVGKGYDITQIMCLSRLSSCNIVIIYIDKNSLHQVT